MMDATDGSLKLADCNCSTIQNLKSKIQNGIKPKGKLSEHFDEIEDPRIERTKRHKLIDILTIAILAVIYGADSWVGMESFGQAKHIWLKRILELLNGIPSHDAFARVFARLNPEQFPACFLKWVRSLAPLSHGEVVAIDGKTVTPIL
jgi:hypothetical protein